MSGKIVHDWTHDGLADDLRVTREECGEVAVTKLALGVWGGEGEMDVLAFRLSRTNPRPTCWEVKVSRADFLADVRSEKFRRYEPWSEFGYFACPSGMVDKREVPAGWGLTVRGENGWHSLRRPTRRPMTPEQTAALYLAVHLCQSEKPWRHSRETRIRLADNTRSLASMGTSLGGKVGAIIRDHAELKNEAEAARSVLCEMLGRPDNPSQGIYWLTAEVAREVRRAGLHARLASCTEPTP